MASEQEIIAAQAAEIERLKSKVASLEDQLYWLRKKMFGKMSEKNLPLDPTVLSGPTLFDDPLTEGERAELDPEVTDTLVLVPAQMYVRRIIRHKLVLKSNLQIKEPERKAFEMVPLPVMPLPKCMASESLLTDIILQKFFYHMPFCRVIQKYKEQGVKISDSTMNDWYAATCEKLKLAVRHLGTGGIVKRLHTSG